MSITLVKRAVKGSAINATEHDANLTNLATAIEDTSSGHVHDGVDSKAISSAYVAKALYDANTILAAITDNTPAAVTVAEQRIVGRKTGGSIAALTGAEIETILGALGESAQNTIRGKNKEIYKTASGDSPLTAAECSGTIVSNYGMTDADCTIDLPTAAEGLAFVCILPTVRARYFRLCCPAAQADKIYLNGTAGSDDGFVVVYSGYATASSCSIFTFKASDGGYDWFCIPLFGTWVAG